MSAHRRAPALRACALAALTLAGCARGGLRLDALPPLGSAGATERYGQGLVASDTAAQTVTFALGEPAEVALVAVATSGRVSVLYPVGSGESSRFTAGSHTVSVPVSMEWVPDPTAPSASNSTREMDALQTYNRCLAAYRPRRIGQTPPRRLAGDTASRRAELPVEPPSIDVGHAFSSDVEACGRPPAAGTAALGGPGAFRVRNDVVVLVVSGTPLTAEALRRRVVGLRVRSEADLRALPLWIAGEHLRPWAGYYSRRY